MPFGFAAACAARGWFSRGPAQVNSHTKNSTRHMPPANWPVLLVCPPLLCTGKHPHYPLSTLSTRPSREIFLTRTHEACHLLTTAGAGILAHNTKQKNAAVLFLRLLASVFFLALPSVCIASVPPGTRESRVLELLSYLRVHLWLLGASGSC
jgi:hypothetical protein